MKERLPLLCCAAMALFVSTEAQAQLLYPSRYEARGRGITATQPAAIQPTATQYRTAQAAPAAAPVIAPSAPVAAPAPVRAASQPQHAEDILAMINHGRAQEAYAILAPQEAQNINDPTYNYLLGLAALDSGRTSEAIQAFERTLSLEPGNLPARAEIARAYMKAGDIDTARRELEIVKNQPNLPQPVRDTMIDTIAGIDNVNNGGGTLVNGYVETGGGYDSNVNTATSDSTVVIPLFAGLGPARLSDDARASNSAFMRNTGHIGITHGISRQTRIFGNATVSDSRYFSKHNYDQTEITGRAGVTRMMADRSLLTGDITAHHSLLDDEGYRTMVGPSVSYERALSDVWRGGAFAQAFMIHYPDMDARDGYRYSGGLGVSRALPSFWGGAFNLSGYLGAETVDERIWEHLAYDFYGARAGIEANPLSNVTTYLTTAVEQRNYDRRDPLFLEERDDTQLDLTLGANYRLTPSWTLRAQGGYNYNFSNIDMYEYDRVTAAAYARYGF